MVQDYRCFKVRPGQKPSSLRVTLEENVAKFFLMNHAPIEIPLENLSLEAQRGLVESFVLREGTDYGVHEVDLDKKIEQVFRQIRSKEVLVCFDPESESVHILTKQEFRRRIANLKTEPENL